jgi:hypothetical protein
MPFVAMRRARLRCGDLPHGWRTFPVSQGGNWTAGKHLDELSTLDRTFIWINRVHPLSSPKYGHEDRS